MPSNLTRTVSVLGIETRCSIGLHDAERAAEQRVLVDVELQLDPGREPRRDDVSDTLDYDRIREAVVRIAGEGHFDLQETLARRIFDAVTALPGVTGAAVRTQKPDAYPDCGTLAYRLSNIG